MSQVSELTCPPASIGNSVDTMLAASVGNSDMLVGGASKSGNHSTARVLTWLDGTAPLGKRKTSNSNDLQKSRSW
jgi:hypothetical protein